MPAPPHLPAERGDPRHELGRLGEELACLHLQRLGFRVLERNARVRTGEIDVIAFDGSTLVFAEVKTARARCHGGPRRAPLPEPLARLDRRQQARLRRLAAAWLADPARTRPRAGAIRMDAVGVVVDGCGALLRLDHVRGAF